MSELVNDEWGVQSAEWRKNCNGVTGGRELSRVVTGRVTGSVSELARLY